MTSSTLSASGIDEIEQLVSEQYLAVRLTSGQQNPRFTATQTVVGPIIVGRLFYDMTLHMDAEPLRAIGVVHSRSGLAQYRTSGQERRWGPGDLYVSSDPADPFTATFDHLDCDFAIYDSTLLGDVAEPVPGDDGPTRLTDDEPLSVGAAQRWMTTFEYVRDTAARPDLTPLVLGSISRLLAAVTLTTFPSNAQLDPTAQDRQDARPVTVRRAIAFIESHPDRDLAVVDIARAAHVSPRALQLAFRRHLDTTPTAYLRRVRLERAHHDLLAAEPSAATVTMVASRWGWSRASRFAADYRRAYGTHPHQTLHQRSGPI